MQGHPFQHDLKILQLDSYDLILGMDWLERYSPMEIHWKAKWISIPCDGTQLVLHGLSATSTADMVFQLLSVEMQSNSVQSNVLPSDIQHILDAFPQVFTVPDSLPQKRACDHAIPLISGATLVNIQAYRYPPQLKDEIDTQVQSMLAQGLIQPSSSPFSSPVLLVRKKDGSWRFCVDYRYLNALTVKSVYPILVFDQLVDELGHAKWFSILDVYSGYHQI